MTQKTITIAGKEYPVIFTMETLLQFEDLTDGNFFEAKFKKTSERIDLIMAAVKSADPKTTLTVDTLKAGNNYDALYDINKAFAVVSDLSLEFFRIPKVVAESEKSEAGDQPDDEAPAKN